MELCERLVGIQLDMKYHMYNKQYLMALADWLPAHGINTVLLEYEDKFPYQKYPFLQAPDAFSVDELEAFLEKLRGNGICVIPLVQSLSHLEFALDHPQLAHLRERPDIPTMICPKNAAAVEFVKDLMNEVLEFHRDDLFFHIGGDETWFLGSCPECKQELTEKGREAMWIEHEIPILNMIIGAGKRPLVWDDIFWTKPETVSGSGVPKETIMVGWNYGITSLDSEGTDDIEFGGKTQKLRQIDVYHEAGYETLGAPCCNYGVLFPRHDESVGNTRAWMQKMYLSDMLGIINTSWACFHVPLQAQLAYFALTGTLGEDQNARIDVDWFQAFFRAEFGADLVGVGDALSKIGRLWEIKMEEFGLPFTPNPYSYMNMVLHYPGRQEERRKRGAYPSDWADIDFKAMYLKGVDEIRQGDINAVCDDITRRRQDYSDAVKVFCRLEAEADRNEELAKAFRVMADLKLVSVNVLSHLLSHDQDGRELEEELQRIHGPLKAALQLFFETQGQERMIRVWWEPLVNALNGGT